MLVSVLLLPKKGLAACVRGLLGAYRVYAPVRRDEELRFDEVTSPEEVVLDYRNTARSPKGALLPQVECLMRYDKERDRYNQTAAVPFDEAPTVILGLRPCDTRSLLLLDAVFGQGQYTDPYYQARRRNTLVFSLACDRPRRTCFCQAFGSGPYDREGADVFLREAGDAYLVEPLTERGEVALAALDLQPVDAAHLAQAEQVEAAAQGQFLELEPVAGIEGLLAGLFDCDVWAKVAEKCLACGTCTFNCPTCHCFNIEDRVFAASGERVRAWDSCQFPIFTLHASGHNPRPDQASRWRQRVMHKFNYLPENVGRYGCVGCGRCVVSCPVALDIRDVLRRVREAHQARAETKAGE